MCIPDSSRRYKKPLPRTKHTGGNRLLLLGGLTSLLLQGTSDLLLPVLPLLPVLSVGLLDLGGETGLREGKMSDAVPKA